MHMYKWCQKIPHLFKSQILEAHCMNSKAVIKLFNVRQTIVIAAFRTVRLSERIVFSNFG